jgi:D-lactate dehydrogenase (cytochrome)/glycolate oxidase
MSNRDVIRELEGVFKDRLITESHILALYSHDASSEVGIMPMALVYPESTNEITTLVKLAINYGFKLLPVGSSTSLSGNATPKLGNTVIVAMERMNKVIEVSDVDWVARVQPGIKVDDLNLELAGYGLQWPVDPASSKTATVGGVINNGGGGMRGAKFGPAAYWVLGLEVVIGTGDVIRVGCRTVKCREGYNLLQLFIGSEGTLGITTEATLRLAPLPESFVGLMAEFSNIEPLVNAVINVKRARLWPIITEFVDDVTAEVLNLNRKYYLWLGIDTNSGGERSILEKLRSLIKSNGGDIVNEADSMQSFMKVLEPRRALYSAGLKYAFSKYGADSVVVWEDIAVPISKLPDAVREIYDLSRKYGMEILLGGHVGDGNLHPGLIFRRNISEEEMRKVSGFISEIGEVGIKYGGTPSAEHGIGTMKKELLRAKYRSLNSENAIDIMKRIKEIFDPHGILNPGKIFD